ncbi:MAG: hypothetical protein Q7P63_11660 [Verrucomicrobiota bacterium JB022]|nr:hypothetical protein [Verrucomicrobiota bacterium JB022]
MSQKRRRHEPEPLPEVEWDFSAYRHPDQLIQVFYYEYCRSSERIKAAVARMRAAMADAAPRMEPFPQSAPALETEPAKPMRCASYLELICNWMEFPEKPFAYTQEGHIHLAVFGPLAVGEPLVAYREEDVSRGLAMRALKPATPDCYTAPFLNTDRHGLQTLVFLGLNWGATDKELKAEFEKFLKRNRPEEFKGLRNVTTRAMESEKLPIKAETALECLGVWRRKQAVNSWSDYIDLYQPEAAKDNFPESDLLRKLKRQAATAEKSFRWLESPQG